MNLKKGRFSLGNNNTPFVFRSITQDSNDTGYTLVIIGWQALKEIFYDFIKISKKNFIIFDYPGIGDNKNINTLEKNSNNLVSLFIKEIQNKFIIDKVIATSAGTAFVLNNLSIFNSNIRFLLLSPQISISILDKVLNIIFKMFLFSKKYLHLPLYKSFINSKTIKAIWVKTVSKGYMNPQTPIMVEKGIKQSHEYWTPKQFTELIDNKNYISKHLSDLLIDNRIHFIIGKTDKLTNIKLFEKLKSKNNLSISIKLLNSNHVIELEAISELIQFIFE